MKILNERPPEWIMTGCLSQFRVDVNHTFWTYGDTIYNPGALVLPDHIVAHEEQHSRQQTWEYMEKYLPPQERTLQHMESRPAKDFWWEKYLTEPRFRLEQEAEAYGAEYKFFCKHRAYRNLRARFLHTKAAQLSGPLYQVAVTHQQASDMIAILAGQKKLPKGVVAPV